MEHLALEVFDLGDSTVSKYAMLEPDASITITDTSEVFESGDVWSHSFTLNVNANAHIFGTAGEIHGSRLHEQIHKRRARLWVEGLPLYLGYLMLGDEAEVDDEGNVDVTFESGQKTFEEMIEGTNAQEVSVGDVVIGVALNRKRVSNINIKSVNYTLNGLEAFISNYPQIEAACRNTNTVSNITGNTPYTQQWPKLVKSKGYFLDSSGNTVTRDYTNIQTPYDAGHPFCNINICYPYKALNEAGEEKVGRGYTIRLAYSSADTTDGGDDQTRFNNAPNFYLLHFVSRLFKDLGIDVAENEMENVEDLRRVFMLNYGCHYEEIESTNIGSINYLDTPDHLTPDALVSRYGQYYMQIIRKGDQYSLVKGWDGAGQYTFGDAKGLEHPGKVLMRNFRATLNGTTYLELGSVEGLVTGVEQQERHLLKQVMRLDKNEIERVDVDSKDGYYSSYLAYATGDNYPNVEISEIIEAMKSMFGVRLLFSDDYKRVRIVLLRNIFKSQDIQEVNCDIVDEDIKVENSIRGFRMTYGKGGEDTSYYYKGFADLFPRQATTWKDTTDKHDYTQWVTDAEYDRIKQSVSPSNKRCYITPVNGNAHGVKVDEDEDVLYPSLFEIAGFMDAEDGDCSGENDTIKEVQCNAAPVIMNEVNNSYAVLFSGDLSAPSPKVDGTDDDSTDRTWRLNSWRSTYARVVENMPYYRQVGPLVVQGNIDIYISEGFRIRLLDNYSISNGGTPFDEADPGLQFGIMRSSGGNAYVRYFDDPDDDENDPNDTWEVVPGSGAIDHPDTCDNYGNEWDYDGSYTITPAQAPGKLAELFPDSDAPFYNATLGYITGTTWLYSRDSNGIRHAVLIASAYSNAGATVTSSGDIRYWCQLSLEELLAVSSSGRHMIIEVDSSDERGSTLVQLCKLAYGGGTEPMRIDNGVGSRHGRFSLKLRAEKLNPYFDPTKVESSYNRRYLPITNENLRQRGLADQFYKEYSYWVRNARIVKRTVHMELAQLLSIDKTKRVTVGDVTGFIRKMQYSVSNETGLGNVVMEIMYI